MVNDIRPKDWRESFSIYSMFCTIGQSCCGKQKNSIYQLPSEVCGVVDETKTPLRIEEIRQKKSKLKIKNKKREEERKRK